VIALMEREFVPKRRLISVDEFVHGVGLSFILLVRFRWHPAFVLAIGAAAGYVKLLP
jgi:hypothetical protein